ncbi:cell division protein ZapD [Alkalispirillum mobile]|uniref:Cell division protein ZapD n=1 Tax=Alkalispirillum mobile TaxID=85925 RepID=A0A498BYL4_9GAMM|nr:cell division protein ZapD [Alkalispirillum mobile]RLK48575.1 cell division protein ZapD [Alkalispirillum mobile]
MLWSDNDLLLATGLLSSETDMHSGTPHADTETLIIYEQPLNERIRTLLRLEHLFRTARQGLEGDSELHSRVCIDALVDVLGVLSRGDVRSEMIKELERLANAMQALQDRPDVDDTQLRRYTDDCQAIIDRLRGDRTPLGQAMRDDELIGSISQRSAMGAGTCGFDVPAYQMWLEQPAAARRTTLERWFNAFEDLGVATALILQLLRGSAAPRHRRAEGGSTQIKLPRNNDFQLIRVGVHPDLGVFPEISGSRYFVTIRFMEQPDTRERPEPTGESIPFSLHTCAI